MPNTILASTTGTLWQALNAIGLDPAALFREVGIAPEVIKDPYARVQERIVHNLWLRAIKVTGDDCLGINAGKYWHPSQFGALGYALLASSTLRTVLNRVARNMWVLNDILKVLLEETPAGFVYTLLPKVSSDKLTIHDDVYLAIMIEICRANYGVQLNPVTVTFIHSEPNCSGDYSTHFRCPVEFGAEQNSLILPMQTIDQPLQGDNPLLAQLNDQVMLKYQAYLERTQFTERVMALIIDYLPSGNIRIQNVADILLVSPRTLQRRLKDEGTCFADLLEKTRREMANKYVRSNTLSLKEITFLLGFSEESTFSRAFKRWTGQSPSNYSKG